MGIMDNPTIAFVLSAAHALFLLFVAVAAFINADPIAFCATPLLLLCLGLIAIGWASYIIGAGKYGWIAVLIAAAITLPSGLLQAPLMNILRKQKPEAPPEATQKDAEFVIR